MRSRLAWPATHRKRPRTLGFPRISLTAASTALRRITPDFLRYRFEMRGPIKGVTPIPIQALLGSAGLGPDVQRAEIAAKHIRGKMTNSTRQQIEGDLHDAKGPPKKPQVNLATIPISKRRAE